MFLSLAAEFTVVVGLSFCFVLLLCVVLACMNMCRVQCGLFLRLILYVFVFPLLSEILLIQGTTRLLVLR